MATDFHQKVHLKLYLLVPLNCAVPKIKLYIWAQRERLCLSPTDKSLKISSSHHIVHHLLLLLLLFYCLFQSSPYMCAFGLMGHSNNRFSFYSKPVKNTMPLDNKVNNTAHFSKSPLGLATLASFVSEIRKQ